jgi:tetracycline 7-halogenase / FADH2 O2-dependent halogenase
MNQRFQFGVIGSGFSGSLLASLLAKRGHSVILLDRNAHPRFAIGESSTPLADFLLEQIADQYSLPALRSLSRWGSWQRDYPQLRAGKKRGFSYYSHQLNQAFHEGSSHENSFLVAASSCDELSDTHWMRSDVDQWFCEQALASGARLIPNFDAIVAKPSAAGWELSGEVDDLPLTVQVDKVIDASGNGNTVAQALGLSSLDDRLRTRTAAMFGHFRNVLPMTTWLAENGLSTFDDPFDGDDAAQHHWIGAGWLWFLRFADGTTSVGLTQPCLNWSEDLTDAPDRWSAFKRFIENYPTVASLLRDATLVAPHDASGQPRMAWMPRISRLWSQAAGKNWLMLPTTAGIIDPLHSTGIAHSLSGVLRAADLLTCEASDTRREDMLAQYSVDVVHEVRWIDQLVSNCYVAAAHSFEAFIAASSLYFVSAIQCERQLAESGEMRDGFLLARSTKLQRVMHDTTQLLEQLSSASAAHGISQWVRQQIQPWNDVGLLDPNSLNRLSRSAAPKAP